MKNPSQPCTVGDFYVENHGTGAMYYCAEVNTWKPIQPPINNTLPAIMFLVAFVGLFMGACMTGWFIGGLAPRKERK